MSEKTPTEAAFAMLVRSSVLMRRVMAPFFSHHGISGSQWSVLGALHRAQVEGLPSVRMTELSDRLLVRTPSVTGIVDRLEIAGLVKREVPEDDHRARQLSLTPAGQRLVGQVLEGHAERIESLLAPLDQQQRRDLASLLGRVADRLEAQAQASADEYVV